jgi:hypothetical protein
MPPSRTFFHIPLLSPLYFLPYNSKSYPVGGAETREKHSRASFRRLAAL